MSVIPCQKNAGLKKLIIDYAEVLKTEAHKLGAHGLIYFEIEHRGAETMRKTRIRRGGASVRESNFTAIKRT